MSGDRTGCLAVSWRLCGRSVECVKGLGWSRMEQGDRGYLTVTWPDDAQGTSKCSVCGARSHVVLLLKCLLPIKTVRGGMAFQSTRTPGRPDNALDIVLIAFESAAKAPKFAS